MAKTVEIEHRGYHGWTRLRFRPRYTKSIEMDDGTTYTGYVVSAAVGHRLNKQVCGITGCTCGERIAVRWEETPLSAGDPTEMVVPCR